MNTADSVSFQSLHMVREELVATIEQAARDLEVYVSSQEEVKSLQACVSSIRQILGIIRVLELKGASMLAEELLATANAIRPGQPGPHFERQLELISKTFFVLTRYLEYVVQTERKVPVLLIPYINELKKFRREPALPESFFFQVNLKDMPQVPSGDAIKVSDAEFAPLLVRLRHMYQLGLLGILRDKQVPASLGLMRRSLIRLQRLGSDKPLAVLWWLSNLAVEAMLTQKMALIESRKMLLSRIDRIIRQVQKGGRSAYQADPPKGLLKELVYILALSNSDSAAVKSVLSHFSVRPPALNDRQLTLERQALQGPSTQTISALVRVLRTEINNIKKVLETSAQGTQTIDDTEGLRETLGKIAETLAIVGLVGPSSLLKEQLTQVQHWQNNQELPDEELDHLAKVLLYVESSVNTLEYNKLSKDQFKGTSEESQNEMIAFSELSQAERIVMQECEAGLLLTKRAITAYSESSFDPNHISNIARTLNSVRGGLLMLKRHRAAAVMEQCVYFVEQVLLTGDHPPALKELLETFADAIISIEYFLDSAATASRLDDSVLQVAEESLAALGFTVRKAG